DNTRMFLAMNIGQRIRNVRKAVGMTQPELARLCGWSGQSRISMYERNERQPSYGDLELIAGALGRPPWFFMSEGSDSVNDRSIARSDMGMTIGHRIRSARQNVRMTQQELADACGWQHQSMVSM